MPANLETSAVSTGLEKVSFHFNPKECSNYHTIALISHANEVVLKILQARLQKCLKCEIPDVQVDLEKAEEPEDQVANIGWIMKKASSRKHPFLFY